MKEMFYLTTHSSLLIYSYLASDIWQNNAPNNLYLQLFGIRHMVKAYSDKVRGNPRPPLHGLLFSNSNKGCFIFTIPRAVLTHSRTPMLLRTPGKGVCGGGGRGGGVGGGGEAPAIQSRTMATVHQLKIK